MSSPVAGAQSQWRSLLLVFVAAMSFYAATLAPTIVWGDGTWYTLLAKVYPLEIGTAGDHPLFILLGRLFTRLPGDAGRNLNLESAVFGALAVTLVYLCARQLGTSRVAAAAGAAALCVSHGFWLHAVTAEVYTANAFFVIAILNLLIAWTRHDKWRYLVGAAAVFILGLTNHLVLAVMTPAVAFFCLTTKPRTFLNRRTLVAATGILGAFAVAAVAIPTVNSAIHKLWVGPPSIWEYFSPTLKPGAMLTEAAYYVLFLVYQFPTLSLILGFVGIHALRRDNRSAARLLLLVIGVNALIFIHHTGWHSQGSSKFVFYIADYAVFAILVAIGADQMLRQMARPPATMPGRGWSVTLLGLVAIVPPVLYAIAPAAATRAGIDLIHGRTIADRDNQSYFLNPNKHGDDGARRFGEDALRAAKPFAVIFADYTPYTILKYLQIVEKARPDVQVVWPSEGGRVVVRWLYTAGQHRPIYIGAWMPDYYDLSRLTGSYELVPAGPMVEVRPRDSR